MNTVPQRKEYFPFLQPPALIPKLANSLRLNQGVVKTGNTPSSAKQYSLNSLYTTYNKGEGEGYLLDRNNPAVIPPEHRQCFEEQTSVRGWCMADQTTVNFPRQFKTSLQNFVR